MLRAAGVHRIPRSTFVTTAIRPLDEAGRALDNHDFRKSERRIFSARGLDRGDRLVAAKKIRVCAQA
jgi:hypothetical protein